MDIKQTIAQNLTRLRQAKGYTQNEIAKVFNYTDKSVSKWEHGDATPPIDVLKDLADFYNVSLDDLVTEHGESFDKVYKGKKNVTNKIIITLLATSIVWLIATLVYVYLSTANSVIRPWLFYIYAIPVSSIVLLVFNGIWGKRKFIFIICSILVWSILLSVYLSLLKYNLWLLFIIGIPLQIACILWSFMKPTKKKKLSN